MENKTGRLMLQRPNDATPELLASNAGDPVIVSLVGRQALVLAAWEERRGNKALIVCQVVANNCDTTVGFRLSSLGPFAMLGVIGG